MITKQVAVEIVRSLTCLLLAVPFTSTGLGQISDSGDRLPAQPMLNAPLPPAQLANPPAANAVPVPSHQAPVPNIRKFSWADFKAQVVLSSDGHFLLTVPQICHTASDPEVRELVRGHSVQTVAQIVPEPVNNTDGHRLRISRGLVQCCSSHARTYALSIDFGKPAPALQGIVWAKVTGKLAYERMGLEIIPILQVTGFEEIAVPAQTLLN